MAAADKKLLLFVLILLISEICAQCNSTQVDINSATAEELDRIDGIGPVYAQRIIQDRPFQSVDSLVDVKGIGNKTLENIKAQGLACVNSEESNFTAAPVQENYSASENTTAANETLSAGGGGDSEGVYIPSNVITGEVSSQTSEPFYPEPINLTPSYSSYSKDIKSGEPAFSPEKIALYGFMAFSVLIGTLFLVRAARKRKYRSEFDNERGITEDKRADYS